MLSEFMLITSNESNKGVSHVKSLKPFSGMSRLILDRAWLRFLM
jgi:hypothetical protein